MKREAESPPPHQLMPLKSPSRIGLIIKICENYIVNLEFIFFQEILANKLPRNVVFENDKFWGKTVKKYDF